MSEYNPFFDDVKERNSMKSGAYHKKNGSKSKKCSLPSDNLTPAQKRKLNGPVKEYELHKAMPWKDFKQMPADLQQAHLDYIQRRFRIGLSAVSREVFGLSNAALRLYAKEHNLTYIPFKGQTLSEPTLRRIANWVNGVEEAPVTSEVAEPESPVLVEQEEPVVDTAPEPEEPAPVPEYIPAPLHIVKTCSVSMSGTAEELICALRDLLGGRDADVELTINFK